MYLFQWWFFASWSNISLWEDIRRDDFSSMRSTRQFTGLFLGNLLLHGKSHLVLMPSVPGSLWKETDNSFWVFMSHSVNLARVGKMGIRDGQGPGILELENILLPGKVSVSWPWWQLAAGLSRCISQALSDLMSPESIPWGKAGTLLPDYGKEMGEPKGLSERWGHQKWISQLKFS